jgi:transcription elongation factor Elf1
LSEAIKSLTRRQLQELQKQIEKELLSCIFCGTEGAVRHSLKPIQRSSGNPVVVLVCKPCFEKFRLPMSTEELATVRSADPE